MELVSLRMTLWKMTMGMMIMAIMMLKQVNKVHVHHVILANYSKTSQVYLCIALLRFLQDHHYLTMQLWDELMGHI